jgi:hypothetical protein
LGAGHWPDVVSDKGLALARWSLVADDVRRGLLAVAGRRFIAHVGAYHFVCPARHLALPKVGAPRTGA